LFVVAVVEREWLGGVGRGEEEGRGAGEGARSRRGGEEQERREREANERKTNDEEVGVGREKKEKNSIDRGFLCCCISPSLCSQLHPF